MVQYIDDLSNVGKTPYVNVVDASSQNYSTRDSQFPGIYNDSWWFWAMVDTEDGKRRELIRALTKNVAFDFMVIECSKDIWSDPIVAKWPSVDDLYWGAIMWMENDGVYTATPASFSVNRSLEISVGPKQYVWKEDKNYIDVVLTPLPQNVTTIYVPGPPDDIGYTSSGCTVTGSVNGSKITGGYGGIDRMYCLPGLSSFLSKIALLEHYWFLWYSILSDGRWETGNIMLGPENFAIATFHRQGERPVVATNDDVQDTIEWVEKDGDRKPHVATFKFKGHTFKYEGQINATAAEAFAGINWIHGTVSEVGGPKPVKSYSTMEYIKITATPREARVT